MIELSLFSQGKRSHLMIPRGTPPPHPNQSLLVHENRQSMLKSPPRDLRTMRRNVLQGRPSFMFGNDPYQGIDGVGWYAFRHSDTCAIILSRNIQMVLLRDSGGAVVIPAFRRAGTRRSLARNGLRHSRESGNPSASFPRKRDDAFNGRDFVSPLHVSPLRSSLSTRLWGIRWSRRRSRRRRRA